MRELILGGQRSGKSRCAESRAGAWLAQPGHDALLIATARAGDAEMAERIARHRVDRAARVPALACSEVPLALAAALREHGAARRLVVVDCLTLWATNVLMPAPMPPMLGMPGMPIGAATAAQRAPLTDAQWSAEEDALLCALAEAPGPVVLVSNEIGFGVVPASAEARAFVDRLGRLHQRVAGCCERVTLMVAGLEVAVKAGAARRPAQRLAQRPADPISRGVSSGIAQASVHSIAQSTTQSTTQSTAQPTAKPTAQPSAQPTAEDGTR